MKNNVVWIVLLGLTLTAMTIFGFGSIIQARAQADASQEQVNALRKEMDKREAEYARSIIQANQRIAQAKDMLGAQPSPAAVQPTSPKTPASPAVSPEQALTAAQTAANGPSQALKSPELVNFEGKTAYEVTLDKGLVYVSAETGEVLFNGTNGLYSGVINEQAAVQIASRYLGPGFEFSKVDQIQLNGQSLFRAVFIPGRVVFVDTAGQVTYVQHVQYAPTPAPAQRSGPRTVNVSKSSPARSGSDDHGSDDHEENDD